jgi:CRISPR-associated protein Csm4
MKLYRLKLKPVSSWQTPWQADTLAGLLCWAYARREGGAALQREIIEPAMLGAPPFVLSDAFPGDLAPAPEFVRLYDWPIEHVKFVRKAKWLRQDAFRRAQAGQAISLDDLVAEDVFEPHAQTRNMLDRLTNTTGAGGNLFTLQERWLAERSALLKGAPYLSIYARVTPEFQDKLLFLFGEVAQTGFGADASVGKGQFDLLSGFEPAPQFDDVVSPDGVIALSTFQPGANDPTDGGWQAFTKFGKLGPDFGLENVFKCPLIMLRPGAFFRSAIPRQVLGRAIPMDRLLSPDVCHALRDRGVEIAHLAFGLAVPSRLSAGF